MRHLAQSRYQTTYVVGRWAARRKDNSSRWGLFTLLWKGIYPLHAVVSRRCDRSSMPMVSNDPIPITSRQAQSPPYASTACHGTMAPAPAYFIMCSCGGLALRGAPSCRDHVVLMLAICVKDGWRHAPCVTSGPVPQGMARVSSIPWLRNHTLSMPYPCTSAKF